VLCVVSLRDKDTVLSLPHLYRSYTEGTMIPTPDQVAASPDPVCPALIEQPVPQFVLTGADGAPFDVNAAIHRQPAILVFYRGGW
jgi:hypothetical protein